jgi:hypothetical protein
MHRRNMACNGWPNSSMRSMVVIVGTLLAVSGCSRSGGSRVSLEAFEPHRQQAAKAVDTFRCPPAGAASLRPSPATGHHRVLLTWHASAMSARAENNAAGYCLYRSQTKGAARKNATCSACEQINSAPVAGTACVDDLVQDSILYYYVATALTADGRRSSSSNEIPVPVPARSQTAKANSTSSYPLCRGTAGSN